MTEHDTSSPLAFCWQQDNEEARCFDVTVEKLCNLAVLSVQEVWGRERERTKNNNISLFAVFLFSRTLPCVVGPGHQPWITTCLTMTPCVT